MRYTFTVLYALMTVALLICARYAKQSRKSIGRSVSLLLLALVPPVIGNLIIIASGNQAISTIGCYIYFIGMDFVMFSLLRFTFDYTKISWPSQSLRIAVLSILGLDILQFLVNPFFHQAFTTEMILVDGFPYYRMIPYFGQTIHRIVDYGIFFAVLLIFFYCSVHVPRIYAERYSVILTSMILTGLLESYYIFSRRPIDTGITGFGLFGFLVYYFALYYRPRRLLDQMLANMASEMTEALFFFDSASRCIWVNRPARQLIGIDEDQFDLVLPKLKKMFGDFSLQEDDWDRKQTVGSGEEQSFYAIKKQTVLDDHGKRAAAFLSIRNETAEQRAIQQEKYNATHDTLTGLYTREYLYEQIARRLKADPDTDYLVVFVDISDFKIVNDIFGNEFGDHVLCKLADWIRQEATARSVYGRLAGDTFGVCMPKEEFNMERWGEPLSHFVVSSENREHPVLIHLGVYEITEPELEISVMFDRARLALTTIKDEYQRHIAYYDDEMRSKVLWNQFISAQLPEALAKRQIRPYLQPIVDVSGKIVGAEALVRWIHPTEGFLSPGVFIPVFEKNGMIAEVDKYMWRSACEILAGWKETNPDLFISVNISPKDFYFMDVEAEIKNVVKEFGVDPSRLRVEITETVMMTDLENRIRILNELKDDGFLVEMDDFGSGYSSLNMLKDMPVDVIKIDMMFLNKSKNDEKARRILHNILSLSADLGIISLTEGVEQLKQYEMLTDMGCKLFQGYYFAKPLPLADFEKLCSEAA
ncbi:MAG: EAL domain-containing protein [Clostridia bacterium]|nr:EAL domain-containing protein [Clostridia bacterium]